MRLSDCNRPQRRARYVKLAVLVGAPTGCGLAVAEGTCRHHSGRDVAKCSVGSRRLSILIPSPANNLPTTPQGTGVLKPCRERRDIGQARIRLVARPLGCAVVVRRSAGDENTQQRNRHQDQSAAHYKLHPPSPPRPRDVKCPQRNGCATAARLRAEPDPGSPSSPARRAHRLDADGCAGRPPRTPRRATRTALATGPPGLNYFHSDRSNSRSEKTIARSARST